MTEPTSPSVPVPSPTPDPVFPPVVDTVVADAPVDGAQLAHSAAFLAQLKEGITKLDAEISSVGPAVSTALAGNKTAAGFLAKRRKTLVAAASAIVAILGTGLIHGDAELALNTVILVLGVIGVHAVPNKD